MGFKTRPKPEPRPAPATHPRPTITQDEADKKIAETNATLASHGVAQHLIDMIEGLIRFAFQSHVSK